MSTVVAAAGHHDLRAAILEFVQQASIEVSPGEEPELPNLVRSLPARATVYVAHTPRASIAEVVSLAVRVREAGFVACPHIVARRLESERQLIETLAELGGAGIDSILLVAGDLRQPAGPFPSTLEVLDSGLTLDYGIRSIGVAGHPEGDRSIGPTLLWQALLRKQAFARSTGTALRIVSQFGFNAQAILDWEQQLLRHGIEMPVHVGLVGPTPLPKLIRYAMRCGIGASLQALVKNNSALSVATRVAITPEEMLTELVRGRFGRSRTQLVQPHFFCFGGAAATASWLHAVREGSFDLTADGARFVVRA